MRNAEKDWEDGCRLDEAWWDVMSDEQKSEYRHKEHDGARHYIRHSVLTTLFAYISDGTIKVTAHKTFALGHKTSEIVYLKKSYFRDFSIIDENKLMKFEFNGIVYEDLKATFPNDWTDGETYTSQAREVDGTDVADQQTRRSNGRPPLTDDFISAFEAIKEEVDLHRGLRKVILSALHKWFVAQGKKPPSTRAMYKYIDKLRNHKLL